VIRDVRIPEGKVTKVFEGGQGALKRILPVLTRKRFTGYLRILSRDGGLYGYVVMRQGRRVLTAFVGPGGIQTGREALSPFKELVKSPDSTIEVHSCEDVSSVVKALKRPGAVSEGKEAFRQKLEEWRREGRDVAALESVMDKSLPKVIKAFAEYKERVEREEELGEVVQKAVSEGLLGEAEELKRRIKEGSLQEAEKRAKDLKRKVARKEHEERAKLEVMRAQRSLMVAGEEVRAAGPERAGRETGLLSRYTFENFVVGDSNRFAHAACLAVAEGTVDPYNPLFLVGRPGLGKTHLLHALGNRILERSPRVRIRYISARRFRTELEQAERNEAMEDLRRVLQALDVLILDDVQDIQGRRRVQDELFDLFEDFHARGKPLVLAADRYPSELEDVDPRLVSRFESGLIADLQPPDLSTRLAYLERLVALKGVSCPRRVLKFLAERFTLDMRELEGALNRVLAYAQAMGKPVDLPLARDALGEDLSGGPSETSARAVLELLPGHSYLIEEERPDVAYRLFAQRVRSVKGLMITRTNPSRVRERFGMEGAEILWLTDRTDSREKTVEPVLERLIHRVESFMVTGGQGVVMLDGVEYLKSNNSFDAVLKFIRRLVDEVSESEFSLIMALNPATLEERELRILEGEMEVFRP
jgi:chromosomal replication initiator protein